MENFDFIDSKQITKSNDEDIQRILNNIRTRILNKQKTIKSSYFFLDVYRHAESYNLYVDIDNNFGKIASILFNYNWKIEHKIDDDRNNTVYYYRITPKQ